MSVYAGGFGESGGGARVFMRALDDDDAPLTSSPLVCNYFF